LFQVLHHAGAQGVQIDLGQAVEQRFAFIDNQAFKTVSPKITSGIMVPIVILGKANLGLPHKFRRLDNFSRK